MSDFDETVVVKVSFVGMSGEGVGTASVFRPHRSDPLETAAALHEALTEAFREAVKDSTTLFHEYVEEKYLNGK